MKLEKSTIIQRVRTILDELSENDSEFDSGKDELELDAIIVQKALEALNFVNGNAELNLLEPDGYLRSTDAVFNEVERAGQIVGCFLLPEKFLRLVYAGYANWDRMVSDYLLPTDRETARLNNKYTTGTKHRPVVLIKFSDEATEAGRKQAYLYSRCEKPAPTSSSSGLQVQPALTTLGELASAVLAYMKFVDSWSNDGGSTNPDYINVSQNLSDAYMYYLAGLVLTTLDDARQQAMYDQAALLMGIHKQSTEG